MSSVGGKRFAREVEQNRGKARRPLSDRRALAAAMVRSNQSSSDS
jgi:hypothetical protein